MSCKELSHRNPEPNQRAGEDFYTGRRTPVKMIGPAAPAERPSAAPIRPSPSRMQARRAALLMFAYAVAAFACMAPQAAYAQVKQRSAAACTLHGVGTGRVAEVRDGRSALLLGRALRLRCPRCGETPLFTGWFAMPPRCAFCGIRFERAQGYFVGAIYVNYGVTVLIAPLAATVVPSICHTTTCPCGPRHRRSLLPSAL